MQGFRSFHSAWRTIQGIETVKVRKWWSEICSAEIGEREHAILKDVTEYGKYWCMAIAQQIIDAERDLRAGNPVTRKIGSTCGMRRGSDSRIWSAGL